jgi:serine/threonine-protein kinase
MTGKSNRHCPQCFHQNSVALLNCELCNWLLKQDLDKTQILQAEGASTSAPTLDSELTQAPFANFKPILETNRTLAEKQTFHLAGDLAHFEIYEILGHGGMGVVYHAKDRTLQRDVALKMLRPMAASNQKHTYALLEEARMASKLNHPNIVTIYDVARAKNSNYIVMEWVEGQGLDALIPLGGLELIQAIEYAYQMAKGLSFAHQKLIVHRDIKPQNIMLSNQNTIKILDFGIADLIKSETKDNSQETNTVIGTPNYMSPEQIQGLNLDQRSDIFSFGIVLYEMLCGIRPFQGADIEATHKAINTGAYIPIQERLPELPNKIAILVGKMLATARDERWQSSVELSQELQAIHNELTYKKNWWQRRSWRTKIAMILPFVFVIGWNTKEIIFPTSTQQLIERHLQKATKIAILPFDNISGDPLIQLFSDGLAVNLGSDLSAIASELGNTWIVPSTEISRMKDSSPKAVANKYGVNLILTGSIQHMGSTRLLVLNLINAVNGQLLKTTEVEINADEIFQGHGMIRQKALSLLNWTIPDSVKDKFNAQRPQLDGAYKEYVKGIGYFYRFDQSRNLIKAEQSFKKAIGISPNYPLAFIGLAETQLLNFRQTKNINWLKKMEQSINSLNEISSDRCQVDYLKGELLTRKGEYQQAIELYNNCLIENPKHISSYLGLANAHAKEGNIETAENYYIKAIGMSPNNVKSIMRFGIFYFRNGNYLKAIEQSKILAELAPNNVNAYNHMAASYYSLNKIDEAIINTLYALKIKPTDSGYSNLATFYFAKSDYKKAISAYQKAIEINPTHYIIWGNLADAYKITNNTGAREAYEKAAELAKLTLKTNPKDSKVIADLSSYLANIGNRNQALELTHQININNNGIENFMVATAYDELGETKLAMAHLKIAISKNYSLEEILNSPLLANTRLVENFETLLEFKE